MAAMTASENAVLPGGVGWLSRLGRWEHVGSARLLVLVTSQQ